MERTLSGRWSVFVVVVTVIAIGSLITSLSLASADEHLDEGPPAGDEGELDEWGYGPSWWDGPAQVGGDDDEDGPGDGEGPQCSPEWLREWYLWEDPEDEEDWWYYWWYKWCQTPGGGDGEEDWVKLYGGWEWWGPAGEDEVLNELLEGWSE